MVLEIILIWTLFFEVVSLRDRGAARVWEAVIELTANSLRLWTVLVHNEYIIDIVKFFSLLCVLDVLL